YEVRAVAVMRNCGSLGSEPIIDSSRRGYVAHGDWWIGN
ncbi:hypothetical protein Tco_0056624, partial [Tanacetum coccineum]